MVQEKVDKVGQRSSQLVVIRDFHNRFSLPWINLVIVKKVADDIDVVIYCPKNVDSNVTNIMKSWSSWCFFLLSDKFLCIISGPSGSGTQAQSEKVIVWLQRGKRRSAPSCLENSQKISAGAFCYYVSVCVCVSATRTKSNGSVCLCMHVPESLCTLL